MKFALSSVTTFCKSSRSSVRKRKPIIRNEVYNYVEIAVRALIAARGSRNREMLHPFGADRVLILLDLGQNLLAGHGGILALFIGSAHSHNRPSLYSAASRFA